MYVRNPKVPCGCQFSLWLFFLFFPLFQGSLGGLLSVLLFWGFFLFNFCPSAGGKWVPVDQRISRKSEKIRSFQIQNQILGGAKAEIQRKRCL